jgi:hypothetical protein
MKRSSWLSSDPLGGPEAAVAATTSSASAGRLIVGNQNKICGIDFMVEET